MKFIVLRFNLFFFLSFNIHSFVRSYLQEAVDLFQDTIEEYKKIHILEIQRNVTNVEQERMELISKTAVAFEDFVLQYAHRHLSESVPQIYNVYKKLGRLTIYIVWLKFISFLSRDMKGNFHFHFLNHCRYFGLQFCVSGKFHMEKSKISTSRNQERRTISTFH